MSESSDYDAIFLEIGTAVDDHLSEEDAADMARSLVTVAARYPHASLHLMVGGFDKDPRELWDIPEARDYVRLVWRKFLALSTNPMRVDEQSVLLVAMCHGAGTQVSPTECALDTDKVAALGLVKPN